MGKAPAKAMTKSAMAKALGEEHEIKASVASKIISSLAEIGTKEVTGTGKFTIPGLVMIKTRKKPATKACKRDIRQDADHQGETGQDRREGLRGVGSQEERLSAQRGISSMLVDARAWLTSRTHRVYIERCCDHEKK